MLRIQCQARKLEACQSSDDDLRYALPWSGAPLAPLKTNKLKRSQFTLNVMNILQLSNILSLSRKPNSCVVLSDSIASAEELAFMLGGEWDSCNGITLTQYDSVAVREAAALIGAKWCHRGSSVAYLPRLTVTDLIDRYRTGDQNFINANLRCSCLSKQCLKGANLSNAFLNLADLTEADLSSADLLGANLQDADLRGANLSNANLFKTDFTNANLTGTNLSNANLSRACLKGANLQNADLSNANLSLADLRGANLDNVSLEEANLANAKLTIEQLS